MIYKFDELGVAETTLELEVHNGIDWNFGNRKILIVNLINDENNCHMMCKSEVLALRRVIDLIIDELEDE